MEANSNHEFFKERCALLVAGELNREERGKVAEHLQECRECRSLVREYTSALACWTSSADSIAEDQSLLADLRLRRAKTNLFARLDHEQGSQMRYAAAAALVFCALLGGYWAGNQRSRDAAKDLRSSRDVQRQLDAQLTDARAQIANDAKVNQRLRSEVDAESSVVDSLRSAAAERDAVKIVNARLRRDLAATAGERDGLNVQTQQLQATIQSLQSTVTQALAKAAEAGERADRLQADMIQASLRAKEAESQLLSQQQYLASDRDIRELMGARNLYMADVLDVGRNGKTTQAQGRIFYTKGKSLVFYAFDLDSQPHPKSVSFQVWGLRGPKTQTVPINMGVFYLDSESEKRWMMKFDDPIELARIDSVFVTVEPAGGSKKPSGPQFMFASLQNQPNHP